MLNTKYIKYFTKHKVDLIYRLAQFESILATKAQTEEIINEGTSRDVSEQDIIVILNIKHTWEKLISSNFDISGNILVDINASLTYNTYNNNRSPGTIRDFPITLGIDDKYVPPVRDIQTGFDNLNFLLQATYDNIRISKTKKDMRNTIIYFYLVGCKEQFFADGNKRTMTIATNYILASFDLGVLKSPSKQSYKRYMNNLIGYYSGIIHEDTAISYIINNYIQVI